MLPKKIKIPESKFQRLILGWALIFGGILGFLPIVGFWMLPLGVVILSVDYHFARRLKRRVQVWWGRRAERKANS